jgi:hypothetical protein
MTDSPELEVEHLVAFPIPRDLHERVTGVVAALREAESASERRSELVEIVSEMTDRGLGYYFLRPLEEAGMGALSQATAKVGLASASKGIPMIVKRVLASASDEELLSLADFVESLLVEVEPT